MSASHLEVARREEQKEKSSITRILLILFIVAASAVIAVIIWALYFREPEVVLSPDYAPREEEPCAEDIPDDSGEKLTSPEGGGSVSITYSRDVAVDLGDRRAALHFANPGKSNQDMVVQIVIRDNVIVQSGTLKPGKQVDSLELLDGAEEQLTAGTYEGAFNVLYYDPESGEKAVVNTEIPIQITVSE